MASFRAAALVAATVGLLAACSDTPTTVVRPVPEPTADSPTIGPGEFRGSRTAGPDPEYVCYASAATPSSHGNYQYMRLKVAFPASARGTGATVPFQVRWVDSSNRVVAAANCRIPPTPEARNIMLDHVLPHDDRRRLGIVTTGGARFSGDPGCVSSGTCALPPLVVVAPIGSGSGPVVPWVDWGSSMGDAPSYGGYYDPGTPDAGGPCNTGAPVFDNIKVQQGMSKLWDESNYEATAIGDRREHFGWIVQNADGSYDLWDAGVAGTVCGYDGDVPYPPQGPDAIVAFVHTHPYDNGENVPTCTASSHQVTGVGEYHSQASDYDRDTSIQLGKALGRTGPLSGVILDADNITVFTGNDTSKDGGTPRCGY